MAHLVDSLDCRCLLAPSFPRLLNDGGGLVSIKLEEFVGSVAAKAV